MAEETQEPTLQANWTNWWGSAQLFASVARAAEEAVSSRANLVTRTSITVSDGHYDEQFAGTLEFVQNIPPEILPKIKRISASTTGEGVDLRFMLERNRRFFASAGHALLAVTSADVNLSHQIIRDVLPAAMRGYQPYWGSYAIPDDLHANLPNPYLGWIRVVIGFVISFVFGAGLYLATARLSIPAPAIFAVGALVPVTINAVVPDIEIALNGRTRMRAIGARLAGATVAPAAAAIVGLFVGS
jgi:hypothetical protein